ncbi:MAG: lysylphosphatidylglycerol synthase transmembrane domain-containing protein [Planctomycetota bacterium]
MSTEGKKGLGWLKTLLKIALLGAAFFVVSTQVDWYDRVASNGGDVLRGKIIEGSDPDAQVVVIETTDGKRETLVKGSWKKGGKSLGIKSTYQSLSLGWYALGMALIFAMYCLGVQRWRYLLRAQGLEASYGRAFRLTFMGFFWNNFVPGLTGGDVAKAVLIAKESPGRRSEAVATVIVDRLIGLAVLALISAAAILCNFDKFKDTGFVIFGVLAALAMGAVAIFSRRVRRALRIDQLLKALPLSEMLMKLDKAFRLYRSHPGTLVLAVALSFAAHCCNIGSVIAFGNDLNINAGWLTYFATVPLILITASIPLFPGGWGVRETAFLFAFAAVGVPEEQKSQIVILSVLLGFSTMIWSLLGGVFLFVGRGRGDQPSEFEAAASETPPTLGT